MDGTLTGTTTQSGPGSKSNEGELLTLYSSRTGTSSSYTVFFRADLTPLHEIQLAYSRPHRQGECYVKFKQPRSLFDFAWPTSLQTMIIVTLRTFQFTIND